MTTLTLTATQTTVTLSDGFTAWTLDRENVRRLIAQLQRAESSMDTPEPERVYSVPWNQVARERRDLAK